MAAVVGVGQGELPQRCEVRLDRVGPGSVSRGETQLDLVLLRPAADVRAGVGGKVVQDDVDRSAVGPADAFATITPALVCPGVAYAEPRVLRRVLYSWAFNKKAWEKEPAEEWR